MSSINLRELTRLGAEGLVASDTASPHDHDSWVQGRSQRENRAYCDDVTRLKHRLTSTVAGHRTSGYA
jgi:hypothetical protein